jgi:ABC-type thiamine transport system ATPase subunit
VPARHVTGELGLGDVGLGQTDAARPGSEAPGVRQHRGRPVRLERQLVRLGGRQLADQPFAALEAGLQVLEQRREIGERQRRG